MQLKFDFQCFHIFSSSNLQLTGLSVSIILCCQTQNRFNLLYNLKTTKFMSINLKKKSCDLTSCSSTDGDSCHDRDEEILNIKTNPLKHKTQLCKNFSELGKCPYGHKCRFAHGAHQLVRATSTKTSFRKKRCNGFWKNGFCSYGVRCQFAHQEIEWQTQAALEGLSCIHAQAFRYRGSKLLSMLKH